MTRRRRAVMVTVALLLIAAVVAVVLLLSDGDDESQRAAVDEPLAYVPAGAEAVLDLDTRAPLVGLAVAELAPRLSGGALRAGDVRGLMGGRAAVSLIGERAQLSLVAASDEALERLGRRLRTTGSYRGARLYDVRGATVAVRGATLIAAADAADVRRALDRREQQSPGSARTAFERRLGRLPVDSSVRVAFRPGPLLGRVSPPAAATRWGRALRDGAAVLTSDDEGIRIPFRVVADPRGLQPADLPIATGPRVPQAQGSAPLVVGLRNLAQAAGFARQAGADVLEQLDGLPGFLRPDVGGLTGDASITSADLQRFTARTDPPDAGDWARKLARLDTLSGLLRRTGLTDLSIDGRDGVYTIERDSQLLVRASVVGSTLVLSNDPRANLRAAAAGRFAPAVPGAAGALTARLTAAALRELISEQLALPSFLLAALGDATGWARAELDGLTGELRLAIRDLSSLTP